MRRLLPPLLATVMVCACGCGRAPTAPVTSPVDGAAAAEPAAAAAVAVTFRVAVPAATPATDLVYVAGDFQGWNPGSPAHALAQLPDGRREITLSLSPGAPIQFKFTRGSWTTVEKAANGEEIANRALVVPSGDATVDFTVQRWADLGTLTGNVSSFTYAPFLSGRRIWVYLPPGYEAGGMRYPVLYMHDGQNLFDVRTSFAGEWRVDETCEQLIGANQLAPLIVIGIENGGGARITEYTPWPAPGYGGGGGDAYLQAIVNVLKPEIDRRYRTLRGPNHTWMAGSSLGGLISAYAGYTYASTFGRVAAVSPSYWWDSDHFAAHAAAQGRGGLLLFYQDMGTIESGSTSDGDGNGVDDSIDDLRAVRQLALSQGFGEGGDFTSVEAAGHTHSESWWAIRTPGMLQFLSKSLGPAGVP